jgi:hypothetical protein
VNNRIVKADDPLMRDHPQTEKLLEKEIKFGEGKSAWLTIVELPDLGQVGNEEAGILPHRSGFYVVRNGRQIMAAQTFGFYRHHHSYSGFRAELAFGGELDDLFHVDIKKSTIHPDDKLLDRLRDETESFIKQSGRRQREAPVDMTKLKLTAAQDVLNHVLQQEPAARALKEAAALPPAAPAAKGKKLDADLAVVNKALEGVSPPPEPQPAPAPVEHKPRVLFSYVEGEPTGRLFESVEKDGQWLLNVNSNHPLARLVAEANNKAASSVLTYVMFALARVESREKDHKATRACILALSEELALLLGAKSR